jgi:hypothetical protein
VYKVGELMVEIPLHAIVKFIQWSFTPFNEIWCYDEKIVHALLVVCADARDISQGIVQDDIKSFIKGKFIIWFALIDSEFVT